MNNDKILKKIINIIIDNALLILAFIIIIITFFLELILPNDSILLEYIYRFHKVIIFSCILLFLILDIIYLITKYSWKSNPQIFITHTLLSLFIITSIIITNYAIFDSYISPKLTLIRVIDPKNEEVLHKPNVEVKVLARKIKWPVSVIVEPPQGTMWVQCVRYLPHNAFKDILIFQIRLGEWYIGTGEKFKIFAVSTKDELEVGMLEKLPPESILSNVIMVTRVN